MLLAGLGCAEDPPPPEVSVSASGLTVRAAEGITRVEVRDPEGVPLLQRPPVPLTSVEVRVRLDEPGTYTVTVDTTEGQHTLSVPISAPPAPLSVVVEAPVGQGRRTVSDGDVVPFTLIDGQPVQAAITLTARRSGDAAIRIRDQAVASGRLVDGRRLVSLATLDGPVPVEATLGDAAVRFTLSPRALTLAEARAALELVSVTFPADQSGRADLGRPSGRVTLPSSWWQSALRATGLGFRPPDGTVPWAWTGVELRNHSSDDLSVVLQLRVRDASGALEPAFRPRMRDGSAIAGQVSALGRVPAGEQARFALPLYIDDPLLTADAVARAHWTRELDIIPIGAAQPLLTDAAPLYVSRGSTAASLGFVLTVAGALGGTLLLLARGPRWLREAPTSTLTTIALFGAMNFLLSAIGRLVGVGIAAVLGPFSTLLTGLIDDALRYALLATLITLLPRTGTVALAALVSWLLSGAALGTFSPLDIVFIGNRVLWLEGALWLAGITRPTRWLDEAPWRRWLRLSAAFGAASVATSATGIVLHIVLYRLFFADWYVAMLLVGPGFLYVLFACALAVPFADSLRRVQR